MKSVYGPVFLGKNIIFGHRTNEKMFGGFIDLFENSALLRSTLSVFIGFVSALMVEYVIDALAEKRRQRTAIYGILDELLSVSKYIKTMDTEIYYVDPLETPFWDALVYDGPSVTLGKAVHASIVTSYKQIENVNNWENLRSNSFFYTNQRNEILDNMVLKNRADLRGFLADAIGDIKEEFGKKIEEDTLALP